MPEHKSVHKPQHEDEDEDVEIIYTYEHGGFTEHHVEPEHEHEDEAEEPRYSGPSKSQLKRDMLALQDLGAQLVKLNKERLAQVDIPEDLRAAVKEAQKIRSHGALRRQMQYIGKLMREVDPAPIQAKLDGWEGKSNEENARFHAMERWRDRLIADEQAFALFMDEHPHTDTQQLRALIRNARKEQLNNQPPKSSRALFRLIREIIEAGGDEQKMADDTDNEAE